MNKSVEQYDVVIAGGGFAGLTLALQLRAGVPELDICIVERSEFPLPAAIAKVGESTVEIGSYYLSDVLGQKEYLAKDHLNKFGLRCFFGAQQDDFAVQDEVGASTSFSIPTYQLDRGLLENHLADEARRHGVDLMQASSVSEMNLDAKGKHVICCKDSEGNVHELQCRWFVDAAGRRGLLKRKLDLQKPNEHQGSSVWLRVSRRIKVDDWSSNADWTARCEPQSERWRSTNHLMGVGYWVWIIPLSSGATSIGVVIDDNKHELADLQSAELLLAWLTEREPRLAAILATALDAQELMDFRYLRDYSHHARKVFSVDNWAMTGEAGVFIDPFYSPGADFIALGNGFITDLIKREQASEDVNMRSRIYQQMFFSFYESTLSLYANEYSGFGDRKLMALKLLWDYSYYWGVLAWMYFNEAYLDLKFMQTANPRLNDVRNANQRVQELFRQRAATETVMRPQGIFVDHKRMPCLSHLNEGLDAAAEQAPDMAALERNVVLLLELAGYVETLVTEDQHSSQAIPVSEREMVGELRHWLVA